MDEDYAIRAYISFNLEDAKEELSNISELIGPDSKFDAKEFSDRMAHLYGHLNTAWNIRNLTNLDLDNADKNQLNLWNQFPNDLKPI